MDDSGYASFLFSNKNTIVEDDPQKYTADARNQNPLYSNKELVLATCNCSGCMSFLGIIV